MSEYSMPNLH